MEYTAKWSRCGEPSQDGLALRKEVFMKEQGFSYDGDACDDISYHLTVYCGKFCAGTARFYTCERGVHAGRIAVKKDYRGLGLGTVLIREICKKAKELGAASVELGAQLHAKGFYQSCGFLPEGDIYREDGVEHINMRRLLD